jgi:hypothetical protein
VRQSAQRAGISDCFSAEYVLAMELSKFYDELAFHLPIFERLRQLCKLMCMARLLKCIRIEKLQLRYFLHKSGRVFDDEAGRCNLISEFYITAKMQNIDIK